MIKLVNRWISIEFIITNKKLNLWQIEKKYAIFKIISQYFKSKEFINEKNNKLNL